MNHDPFSVPVAPSRVPPRLRRLGSIERWIDDELAQSFPASDPPSWTLGTAEPASSPEPSRRSS